jgi:hypothetical protein
MGVSLHGGPVGKPGEGGPSTGNFEKWLKEGTGCGASLSLSLWDICEENLEVGPFAGGPEDHERKALRMGISLHGGSVGQPGVGSSTGDFGR